MDGTGRTDHEPLAAEDNYPVGAPSANLIDLARGARETGLLAVTALSVRSSARRRSSRCAPDGRYACKLCQLERAAADALAALPPPTDDDLEPVEPEPSRIPIYDRATDTIVGYQGEETE